MIHIALRRKAFGIPKPHRATAKKLYHCIFSIKKFLMPLIRPYLYKNILKKQKF